MKNKLGEWYPYNPFPVLRKGQLLKNYVFNDIELNAYRNLDLKRVLDYHGFQHPVFYRKNIIAGTVFHEFMTTNPKNEKD